jgi:hypothetical protein
MPHVPPILTSGWVRLEVVEFLLTSCSTSGRDPRGEIVRKLHSLGETRTVVFFSLLGLRAAVETRRPESVLCEKPGYGQRPPGQRLYSVLDAVYEIWRVKRHYVRETT